MSAGMSLLFAAAAAAAPAKVPAGPPPAVISSVVACRNIAQAERRLKCYDDAAAALSSAVSTGNVIAMDRQAVVKTRKELLKTIKPAMRQFIRADTGDIPEDFAPPPPPTGEKRSFIELTPQYS